MLIREATIDTLKEGSKDASALFFIPSLTGEGKEIYAALAKHLQINNSCLSLNASALADESLLSVNAIASTYLTAIRAKQPKGPYYLFGWSFGALVALQIAIILETVGDEIGLITMIDPILPHVSMGSSQFTYILFESLATMCEVNNSAYPNDQITFKAAFEKQSHLSYEKHIDYFLQTIKTKSPEANSYLRIAKKSLLAAINYEPTEAVKGRVLLFVSTGVKGNLDISDEVFSPHPTFFSRKQSYTKIRLPDTRLSIILEPTQLIEDLHRYLLPDIPDASITETVTITREEYSQMVEMLRKHSEDLAYLNKAFTELAHLVTLCLKQQPQRQQIVKENEELAASNSMSRKM